MYNAILLVLLAAGGLLASRGVSSRRTNLVMLGAFVIAATLAIFWFFGFWGELLWFDAVGYSSRFMTVVLVKAGTLGAAALLSFLFVKLMIHSVRKASRPLHHIMLGVAALAGAAWGAANWEVILRWRHAVDTGLAEPVFGMDTGFYLFILPFIDNVLLLLGMLAFLSFFASLGLFIVSQSTMRDGRLAFHPVYGSEATRRLRPVYVSAALILFLLAAGKYLDRFHLMFSQTGVVSGPGWTDVHVRIPAYWICAVVTALVGIVVLIPQLRKALVRRMARRQQGELPVVLAFAGGAVALTWFLALSLAPGLMQWLRVEPNEISLERPYITNNIRYTRIAFGLDRAEEKEYPVTGQLTRAVIDSNPGTFSNIRLWDWRALDAVYRQFQEIRLYYEFQDVDIDRYVFDGRYRQVMVSARELNVDNLPGESQTFVNERFKYTHGNGITLTTVSEFTPEGLPNLLIRDIPPVSTHPELEVTQPRIYYGETANHAVVVNSLEQEFDYPKGDENVYMHYDGTGGVQLSGALRKFIYGWMFDGTRFLLSSYIKKDSRIMFDRNIAVRVQKIAPFLEFDADPYIVLHEGRLFWIMDGYTTSTRFPYSEPFSARETFDGKRFIRNDAAYLDGVNYIRNSVKVTVDAYNGNVDFYVSDGTDPVIKVWGSVFPGMFRPVAEMPDGLFAHTRYPSDLLLVQGLVYAKYHMNDPAVFYNQEDLWVRATEKYYGGIRPVEPYYVMWQKPGSDKPDFVLILPFTPKNKQVMIGWIAGMCDGDNYGRFLAYLFPKDKRILGPQQVETKIDQDSYLSGQLTLWDQRGSSVIRGNVLAIPVGQTIMYVEPIYLQSETAAYPELRLVAVMHGDKLAYAETFEEALAKLTGLAPRIPETTQPGTGGPSAEVQKPAAVTDNEKLRRAGQAFDEYLKLTGEGKFGKASEKLDELQKILND